ncbi:hypothetical protein [uncultured Phocaeicola sp.]|uniref:hypothetical protein n=1 Tax=uncultured Phocaeicola sp. TaxID=990718 RepID=UPI0025E4F2B5|nr:hypothetical protein [uncultured Phocaeicola sp.]
MFYIFVLAFSCLVLLFLFAGKKKKITKRKTAVCSFKAAARLRTTEAQELASLKQPALLFAVLRFSAFRLETEDGIFLLASLFALWAKSLCGFYLRFFAPCSRFFALSSLGEIAGVSAKLLLTLLCSLLSLFCFILPGRNRCVFSCVARKIFKLRFALYVENKNR